MVLSERDGRQFLGLVEGYYDVGIPIRSSFSRMLTLGDIDRYRADRNPLNPVENTPVEFSGPEVSQPGRDLVVL